MGNQKRSIPVPVGSFEGDVTTWALPEGAIARLGRGSEPAMAFSPDGQSLVIGTCTGLWLYDLTTLSPVALWETEHSYTESVAFSPNGKWIAASFSGNLVKILDVQNGTCLARVKSDTSLQSVTFSHDNRYVAANVFDYEGTSIVEVWHTETGKPYAKFTADDERTENYRPISFSPDTRLIASTCMAANSDDAGSIIVWDMKSREQIACLSGHTRWVTALCFSPCGQFLTSGGEDGKVYVWDVNTWQQVKCYTDYGRVYSIIPSYSPNGMLRAAIVHYDETGPAAISVRDLESNEQLYNDLVWGNTIRFAYIGTSIGNWGNNVLFTNGSQLAHECRHEFINVWTLDNPIKRQFTHSPIAWPKTIVFSQDGKTLAAEHFQEGVVLWDIESKHSRPAVQVESAGKNQFVYKTDSGKLHVASIKNDTVTLWEADGDGIPLIEGIGREYWSASPALAPSGTLFAYAGEDGTVKVLDVQNEEILHEFTHHLEPSDDDEGDYVDKLEFSQDGKLLVSRSRSHNVRLWDMELGEEIKPLPGDEIKGVRFCRCGRSHAYLDKKGKQYWDITQREYCEDVTCLCDPTWSEIEKRLSIPPEFERFEGPDAYSLCGQYVALGTSHKDLKSKPIDLWEVSSGKHHVTFRGPTDDLEDIAFSPNNKLLASSCYDGTILLWDLTPYL